MNERVCFDDLLACGKIWSSVISCMAHTRRRRMWALRIGNTRKRKREQPEIHSFNFCNFLTLTQHVERFLNRPFDDFEISVMHMRYKVYNLKGNLSLVFPSLSLSCSLKKMQKRRRQLGQVWDVLMLYVDGRDVYQQDNKLQRLRERDTIQRRERENQQ